MKKTIMIIMFVGMVVPTANAAWTYIYGPGSNFFSKGLEQNESMLVNGGKGGGLTLSYNSYARIESTTPLGTDYGGGVWAGGIWSIDVIGSSSRLEVLGGEIGELDQWNSARVWLYGGTILTLQSAPIGSSKYIDLFCKSYSYNSGNRMLTGIWGDDSVFSIHLVNVSGYSPTVDNINFIIIPEPLTLGLFACGALFVRRYCR